MNEISVFLKETPENSLTSSALWRHSEKVVISEPGSGLSLYTESASTLISDFPASTTEK